jgi:uncharacterized protein YbjT (DUF2867 family)
MRVLVIGATGLTGRIAVRRLLERGDEVTAFARSVDGVATRHERLRVAVGSARDAESVLTAVQGHDAVLSAFGPRSVLGKSDLQEVFMRNLVGAMTRAGVKRLSNLSAWGAGDSYRALTWFGRAVMRLAGEFFEDKNRGERILLSSALEFVNVRPPRLTNGPGRGGVKAALTVQPRPWFPLLSREDVAAFMIDQLNDNTWLHQSPLIWR